MNNHKDKQQALGRRGALGKGISSLLGGLDEEVAEEVTKTERQRLEAEVVRLDIADVDPNPHQPRKIFDDVATSSSPAKDAGGPRSSRASRPSPLSSRTAPKRTCSG
jgi:hypothetical protein